ncbi:MAG: class I SAM-dependent methyltransferase [Pseudobutyrivibrio sp.]|nr:class I SAM-dependent methyltransferase [Pseudobutyrivibrio sp.]
MIIYGAGKIAKENFAFISYLGFDSEVNLFCDIRAKDLKNFLGKRVVDYKEARKLNDYFVIGVQKGTQNHDEISNVLEKNNEKYYDDIFSWLSETKGMNRNDIYRDYCAYYHVHEMDSYFEKSEYEKNLNVFWNSNSVFYKLFCKLDLTSVVELACGRGRHVPYYYDKAKQIMLVDILEQNLNFCKERFNGKDNISYYCNNGKDLSDLGSSAYTSLFTYDAMVHFELIDINSYLSETYRILKKGGYALFHHSNDDSDYRNWFGGTTNPGGRSFMSKKIFAHLAYRNGFEIVDQVVIDWSASNMDCITLVRKP